MNIGSVSEDQKLEKRVALTPEIAKKYINLGFKVCVTENYGQHLGFKKSDFVEQGVEVTKGSKEVIEKSNIILQMGLLNDEKLSILRSDQIYIGVLNPHLNSDKLNLLSKKNIKLFSLIYFQELQEHNQWIYCLLKLI